MSSFSEIKNLSSKKYKPCVGGTRQCADGAQAIDKSLENYIDLASSSEDDKYKATFLPYNHHSKSLSAQALCLYSYDLFLEEYLRIEKDFTCFLLFFLSRHGIIGKYQTYLLSRTSIEFTNKSLRKLCADGIVKMLSEDDSSAAGHNTYYILTKKGLYRAKEAFKEAFHESPVFNRMLKGMLASELFEPISDTDVFSAVLSAQSSIKKHYLHTSAVRDLYIAFVKEIQRGFSFHNEVVFSGGRPCSFLEMKKIGMRTSSFPIKADAVYIINNSFGSGNCGDISDVCLIQEQDTNKQRIGVIRQKLDKYYDILGAWYDKDLPVLLFSVLENGVSNKENPKEKIFKLTTVERSLLSGLCAGFVLLPCSDMKSEGGESGGFSSDIALNLTLKEVRRLLKPLCTGSEEQTAAGSSASKKGGEGERRNKCSTLTQSDDRNGSHQILQCVALRKDLCKSLRIVESMIKKYGSGTTLLQLLNRESEKTEIKSQADLRSALPLHSSVYTHRRDNIIQCAQAIEEYEDLFYKGLSLYVVDNKHVQECASICSYATRLEYHVLKEFSKLLHDEDLNRYVNAVGLYGTKGLGAVEREKIGMYLPLRYSPIGVIEHEGIKVSFRNMYKSGSGHCFCIENYTCDAGSRLRIEKYIRTDMDECHIVLICERDELKRTIGEITDLFRKFDYQHKERFYIICQFGTEEYSAFIQLT